jgi:hypothetical protein
MPFVWSIGTIIGPSIGGIFAEPYKTFPDIFPVGGLFYHFPYLLPNLICAALLLVSIVLGYCLLEETHPDMVPRVMLPDNTYVSHETPLLETSDALKQPAVDFRSGTYGTFGGQKNADISREMPCTKEPEKGGHVSIFTKRITALIVALSIFTYHSMTYDHLLPIFFEDKKIPIHAFGDSPLSASLLNPFYSPGGLGLSMQSVGAILAVNGIIALFVQAVIFPVAAATVGISRLFILVTVLHPIAYLVMPMLIAVPDPLLYPAIYACLSIRNILSIILYPLLLILIKDATPCSTVLGKINGLAASAGAACRMVAPPVAGYLYTIGSQHDFTALAWYGSALVAVIGAIQCFCIERESSDDKSEESGFAAAKFETTVITVREVSDHSETSSIHRGTRDREDDHREV